MSAQDDGLSPLQSPCADGRTDAKLNPRSPLRLPHPLYADGSERFSHPLGAEAAGVHVLDAECDAQSRPIFHSIRTRRMGTLRSIEDSPDSAAARIMANELNLLPIYHGWKADDRERPDDQRYQRGACR
jgi:hypothetical protein